MTGTPQNRTETKAEERMRTKTTLTDRKAKESYGISPPRQEIKEQRRAEDSEKSDADWARPPSDYGQKAIRTTVIVLLVCIALGCAIGTFLGTKSGEMGSSIVVGAFGMAFGTLFVLLWLATAGR
jgi:hypothetical protein